jgi:NAD(P)-dependent dehydrogenase (short-subunit alcohol dehydrogenase family)
MEVETTVSEVEARGAEAMGLEVGVTDPAAVDDAVRQLIDHWGGLNIVVCNAGGEMGTLAETTCTLVSDAHLETHLQRNLNDTIYTLRAAAVPMKARAPAGSSPSPAWPDGDHSQWLAWPAMASRTGHHHVRKVSRPVCGTVAFVSRPGRQNHRSGTSSSRLRYR